MDQTIRKFLCPSPSISRFVYFIPTYESVQCLPGACIRQNEMIIILSDLGENGSFPEGQILSSA